MDIGNSQISNPLKDVEQKNDNGDFLMADLMEKKEKGLVTVLLDKK